MRLSDIHLRDPFILAQAEEAVYYMYGTTGATASRGQANGFDVYVSEDLQEWDGPFAAFRPDDGFWSDHHHWAPEVHVYRGRYYMLASFKAEGHCRGTQILVADHPRGPFVPFGDGPITPSDWECLDGTLYVDRQGKPWIVFCHEWLQVGDGEICAMLLDEELKTAVGEPQVLFTASQAPWTVTLREGRQAYVTDGPYVWEEGGGENSLRMLWSSFSAEGYAIGVARSASGDLLGPWALDPEPFLARDGGHGMLLTTFEGERLLVLHAPNVADQERPLLIRIGDEHGGLSLLT